MFAIIRVLDDTRNGIAHTATRHIGIVGPFMFFRRRNQRREILFDHKNDERSDR